MKHLISFCPIVVTYVFAAVLVTLPAYGQTNGPKYLNEVAHSALIAETRGWDAEYQMPDGTRCDLVSPKEAIEVEWASKWKEAPAQAVLYSIWTGKEPAVILLVKSKNDDKLSILRCKLVCERLGIRMETFEAVKE